MQRVCRQGLNYRSYYSGQDCFMQMVYMVVDTLIMETDLGVHEPSLCYSHACDVEPSCRRCLVSWPASVRARHIFGDLCERRGPDVCRALQSIEASHCHSPVQGACPCPSCLAFMQSHPGGFLVFGRLVCPSSLLSVTLMEAQGCACSLCHPNNQPLKKISPHC